MARHAWGVLVAALTLALALAGCTPAGVLNTWSKLSAGDEPATLAVKAAPYGPERRQKLDVWTPDRAAPRLRPVVVFFYGGGWTEGSRTDYQFVGRALAAQGFVAVVPDYRLVPQVRFPAFVQDGAAALAWVRANVGRYGGDPKRISVAGHSAGAYIAALLSLDPEYLAKAGLPATTIRAAALLSGPFDFPLEDPRAQAALGNWPRPDETQPIHYVHPGAPAIWLGYGHKDKTVDPGNSTRLADRLRAAGDEVTVRNYPKLTHAGTVEALSKPFRKTAPVLADLSAFLFAHTR